MSIKGFIIGKNLKGVTDTTSGSSLGLTSPAAKPKQNFDNILVTGGLVDNCPIGSVFPSSGAFTNLTSGNANGQANNPPSLTTFYGTFPNGSTPKYFQWNPATNTANIQGSLKVSNNDTQLGNITVGNSTIGTNDNSTLNLKSPIPTFQAKDNETDASIDHGLQFTIANGNQAYFGYAAKYNGFAALTNASIVNDIVQGGTPAPITCAYINTSSTNPDGTISPGSSLSRNSLTFPNSPATISSPDVLNLNSNHILIGSGQSSGTPARLCFIHNPQSAAPGYDCRSYISLDPNSTNLDFVNESGQLNLRPGGTTPTVSLGSNSKLTFDGLNSPSISQTSTNNLHLTTNQLQLDDNSSIQFGIQNSINSSNNSISIQSQNLSLPSGLISIGTNGILSNGMGNQLTLSNSQGNVVLDGLNGVNLKDINDKLYFGTDSNAPSISRDNSNNLNLNSNHINLPQNSTVNLGGIQLSNYANSNLAISNAGNVNYNIGGKFYINGVEIPQHFNADGSNVTANFSCPPQKQLSIVSGRNWDNIKSIGPVSANDLSTYVSFTTPTNVLLGQQLTVFNTTTNPSSDVAEATVSQVISPTEIVLNSTSPLASITNVTDGQITLPMNAYNSKAEGDKIYWYGQSDSAENTAFFGLDPKTEKLTYLNRNSLDSNGDVNSSGQLGGVIFADGSFTSLKSTSLQSDELVSSDSNGVLRNISYDDVSLQTVNFKSVSQAGALMRQGGISNAMTGNLFYSFERLIWDITTVGCQLNINVQISYFSVTNITNLNSQKCLSVALPNGFGDGQTKMIVVTSMPKFMEVNLTGSFNCPTTVKQNIGNSTSSVLPPNMTAMPGPCCCKNETNSAQTNSFQLKLRHQRASVHLIWDNVMTAWININSGGLFTQ